MNLSTVIIVILSAALILTGLLYIKQRIDTRRILDRIDGMINDALDGEFREENFDESLISSVESHMAQYLSSSVTSSYRTKEEKENISSLISDIAHQTRTPMANLRLYTQLLEEEPLNRKAADCVDEISKSTERLGNMIEALVKASRLESGIIRLRPLLSDVSVLAEESLTELKSAAEEKNISLTLKSEECAMAYFDPVWTKEALTNIIDNAVKYTPEGGSVEAEIKEYEMFCRIDISDTGPGVLEKEQAEIFGRFFRGEASKAGEGLGIGLYLARKILSGQGGYIKVQNREDKGAVFSLFLKKGEI